MTERILKTLFGLWLMVTILSQFLQMGPLDPTHAPDSLLGNLVSVNAFVALVPGAVSFVWFAALLVQRSKVEAFLYGLLPLGIAIGAYSYNSFPAAEDTPLLVICIAAYILAPGTWFFLRGVLGGEWFRIRDLDKEDCPAPNEL